MAKRVAELERDNSKLAKKLKQAETIERPSPPLALTTIEEQSVRCMHEPRFRDLAPSKVYATLLDEGMSIAQSAPCTESWQSMTRCVNGENR